MHLATLAAACVTLATAADAQQPVDPVARHRRLYQLVERSLGSYRHVSADMDSLGLERQSTEGGHLEAYCDGGAIRLLVAEYSGETGDTTERFYFDGDTLFFVLRQSRRGIPDGVNPYPRRTIFEDQRFYFDGPRLVRWLGPKKSPRSVRSESAHDETRELLADARRLSAVMPACNPRFAPL